MPSPTHWVGTNFVVAPVRWTIALRRVRFASNSGILVVVQRMTGMGQADITSVVKAVKEQTTARCLHARANLGFTLNNDFSPAFVVGIEKIAEPG